MSSTTNIQNLLVNVFRPLYYFDTTSNTFVPRLDLSNVNTYSGNAISVIRADIGDINCNVYVGIGAGTSNATGITGGSYNVTSLGYNAGSGFTTTSNSVFLGYNAGGTNQSNIANTIVLGPLSTVTNGTSNNILIGYNSSLTGSSNIIIGNNILGGTINNQLRIGTSNHIAVGGDFTSKWVGINTATPLDFPSGNHFDVSGTAFFQNKVGMQMPPNNSLDVNGITLSTLGFTSIQTNNVIPVGLTTIGELKIGEVHVSAVDRTNSTNRACYNVFAHTVSNSGIITFIKNGTIDICFNTTNIQLSNSGSSSIYDYSITYFPLKQASP